MKKNIGKIYRIVAAILGVIACLLSTYFAYYQSKNIFSLKDKNIQTITFIKYIFIYWIIILIVFLFFYGIGFVIELLQSIDSKLLVLTKKLCNDSNEMESKNDEVKLLEKENIWKRPEM